jgi:hypothetical protein
MSETMPGMRFALLLLVSALLFPAGAQAACGVPSPRAEYETPDVQVYVRKGNLVACHRATGKARVVGVRANDGMGTDEYTAVVGAIGGRWLWTSFLASFAESADVRVDTLTDLRTGKKVEATVEDEDTSNQVIVLPGALIVAGPCAARCCRFRGATRRPARRWHGRSGAAGPSRARGC